MLVALGASIAALLVMPSAADADADGVWPPYVNNLESEKAVFCHYIPGGDPDDVKVTLYYSIEVDVLGSSEVFLWPSEDSYSEVWPIWSYRDVSQNSDGSSRLHEIGIMQWEDKVLSPTPHGVSWANIVIQAFDDSGEPTGSGFTSIAVDETNCTGTQ